MLIFPFKMARVKKHFNQQRFNLLNFVVASLLVSLALMTIAATAADDFPAQTKDDTETIKHADAMLMSEVAIQNDLPENQNSDA